MTVSRVLRGAPKVAPETRTRVLAAVEALGYQPDPDLARMMEAVRARKKLGLKATIAVIREHVPEDGLLSPSYQYVPVGDIRRPGRAATATRWRNFSSARTVSLRRSSARSSTPGASRRSSSRPRAPVSSVPKSTIAPFAAVAFGYAMREPALHMCAGNMTLGIQTAAEELSALGYRRIGVAVTQWIVNRSQFGYSGGFFHFQQSLPPEDRIPLLLLPHNRIEKGFAAFSQWMGENRPDVLISFDTHVPEWIDRLGLRCRRTSASSSTTGRRS